MRYVKSRLQIMMALPVALSLAACSLSNRSSHRLIISMPEGGFSATSISSMVTTGGGSSSFSMPSVLSDFKCIGVVVTGEGLPPDPAFGEACRANPAVMPRGLGKLVGLVPASGGSIDIQVPGGTSRLIQLVGVQASGDCPNLLSVFGSDSGGSGLGNPYEIGRVEQDIFADQTIEIKAIFNPATAQKMFSCHDSHDGPIAFSNLDLYPHSPSSSGHVRVIGSMTGDAHQINLYSDAGCMNQLPTGQWNRSNDGTFSVEANSLSASSSIFIRGQGSSGSSACTPVPGSYVQAVTGPSGSPSVHVNNPYSGSQLTGGQMTPMITGSCGPMYAATVEVFVNGASNTSCNCDGSGFSCQLATIAAVPDGPVFIKAVVNRTADSVKTDDAIFVIKDSQAPDLAIVNPSDDQYISGAGVTAFSINGTCGMNGTDVVSIGYSGPGDFQVLDQVDCSSGNWSAALDLSSLPDGFLSIGAALTGATGHETRRYKGIHKNQPQLSNTSPPSGPPAGGTAITVYGSHFLAGATVTIGGQPCTGLTVVDSATITCTTPSSAIGNAQVIVTNSGGASSVSSYSFYYLGPAPTVASISPPSGSGASSTMITITGSNFKPGGYVYVGPDYCSGLSFIDSTTVTCMVPSGAANASMAVIYTNPSPDNQTSNGNVYFNRL